MSLDPQALQADWNHLDHDDLHTALPHLIVLDDIPALPLAHASDMPPQAGFARGALSIELGDLQLQLADRAPLTLTSGSNAEGHCVLALQIADIALVGRQTLQGTQIWETGLDGAGTGLPRDAGRRGGADQNVHPAWVQTAQDQRAALQNLPGGNGATMLSTYTNHRAAFNDVFTDPTAYAFQIGWGVQEITDMAADTNTAVNTTGMVVNDPKKVYGSTTYNGNAQSQQLALLTTLTAMAANNEPGNPTDSTNPYNLAAAATLSFGTGIVQNAKVAKINDVPPKTKATVYQMVLHGTPPTPHTVQEVHDYLSGNPIGGRDANGNTWTMALSEDERAFVRKMQADFAEHAARLAAQKPVALAAGGLHASLGCYVYLQFDVAAGEARLVDGRVELDGFDLDFDDSGWDAELGLPLAEAAREALGEARFIKSLLHDRIADALERALVPSLAQIAQGKHQ
ncbi:hypothetical protein [Paludibacterium purpuratum]|uniref:Uncharacterized protein n=1 Tax=Paludibacterium purpuratum TaxID=1144873 RepID=A0A4R7BDU0_9NEIS|nr:hypothetical protein [Paludibacterium purpuratum]TDR81926.1 hypothetical protein DFP86_10236 [Paludibacterium purpuratum]